ncbi:hypothetical protein SAMN06273572_1024 [Monaibacterium marinum]|uniref:Uncharacterized protein n=1 Tax=Pontivivens marinum TaxID=1690039 RepID=A0A2C9CSH5_9RHOB|nr:hypothetical protein SAMN06273572_1024 [Monaibacterium marinum]
MIASPKLGDDTVRCLFLLSQQRLADYASSTSLIGKNYGAKIHYL